MEQQEWIVTKYDDFGEPLLRERVTQPSKAETELERYRRMEQQVGEALF